jgi:hypothetical protein
LIIDDFISRPKAENNALTVLLAHSEGKMDAKRAETARKAAEKGANWRLTSPGVAETGRRMW